MESYLDFGSDSDSDGDRNDFAMDSDEEEAVENEKLYKMLMSKSQTRKNPSIQDFEAEMELDLDKRAHEVETRGGLEHQKSLSRSSSSSSLNIKSPCPSPSPSSQPNKPGGSKKRGILMTSSSAGSSRDSVPPPKKSVKFTDSIDVGSVDVGPSSASLPLPPPSSTSTPMELDSGASVVETVPTEGKSNNDGAKVSSFYDEIYFDSDESEGEDEQSKRKKKDKRSFKSNDELFYDPTSDSKDQAWVDRRRRRYAAKTAGGPSSSTDSNNPTTTKTLPNSDAILNCPACFTVLCLDCQRHEIYAGQYRAMFVMNCSVVKDEVLHVPLKEPKWKKKRKGKSESTTNDEELLDSNPAHLSPNDSFNPVKCKICNSQVGVYDSEEVYHFFNILASQA